MNEGLESPSYLRMRIHLDKENFKELRVPTFWDATKEQWIGAIKTPKTKRLITATGKDSFDLQNNFNIEIRKIFDGDDETYNDEVFGMFKEVE